MHQPAFEALLIDALTLGAPQPECVCSVDRRLPVLPGPQPFDEKVLNRDDEDSPALELDPPGLLLSVESARRKFDEQLRCLVDPMPAVPFETGGREGARYARGHRTDQIDIAGCVRPDSVELNRRTADQYRHGAVLLEETLKPHHQRGGAAWSLLARKDPINLHRYRLYIVIVKMSSETGLGLLARAAGPAAS